MTAARRRPARPRRSAGRARSARPVALTGTPGVGKTAVALALRGRRASIEVADLALRTRTGTRRPYGVEVDLARLRRTLRRDPSITAPYDLLVGHLAHLLPVREAIVLRCHPTSLRRRLSRRRSGTEEERAENLVSEALDLVVSEAFDLGVPVYEIDTTGRSVRSVATEVDRRLRLGGRARRGIVDWLSDPAVTEHLLDGAG